MILWHAVYTRPQAKGARRPDTPRYWVYLPRRRVRRLTRLGDFVRVTKVLFTTGSAV